MWTRAIDSQAQPRPCLVAQVVSTYVYERSSLKRQRNETAVDFIALVGQDWFPA
jgi:hypothetical protein